MVPPLAIETGAIKLTMGFVGFPVIVIPVPPATDATPAVGETPLTNNVPFTRSVPFTVSQPFTVNAFVTAKSLTHKLQIFLNLQLLQ